MYLVFFSAARIQEKIFAKGHNIRMKSVFLHYYFQGKNKDLGETNKKGKEKLRKIKQKKRRKRP